MSLTIRLGSPELLYNAAYRMGLKPTWVTPKGMFAFDLDGSEVYVNAPASPLNSQNAASLAQNKNLTRIILERHDFMNIPFLCSEELAVVSTFLKTHQKIIAKPNKGFGANDIHVISEIEQLQDLSLKGYIFEKYIAGSEHRYLVLDDHVVAVHISEYGTSVKPDRYLERYSLDTDEWNQPLMEAAVKATQVLGLRFAAVDFMVEPDDTAYVLEVNSKPGLKWFHAPTSGPPVDIAASFLKTLILNRTSQPLVNSA